MDKSVQRFISKYQQMFIHACNASRSEIVTNKQTRFFKTPLAGTNLPEGLEPLFVSERNGKTFSYNFDVSDYPNGSTFDVTLWMAEIYHSVPGIRIFNVVIESEEVITKHGKLERLLQ